MPKRSVNDLSDLGTSRRCRQLAVNIRRTKGEGLERVFDTMIGSIGRAEFWKLLDTEARWPRVYVNLFASHASSAMGLEAAGGLAAPRRTTDLHKCPPHRTNSCDSAPGESCESRGALPENGRLHPALRGRSFQSIEFYLSGS